MRRALIAGMLVTLVTAAGCTKSGEIYDAKRHTEAEYSKGNTAAATVGTIAALAAVIAVAANNGGGGGYYAPTDYDYAWDYQPMNGQWACRGKQTGQYAYPRNCQFDPVNDFTWPG